MYPNMKTPGNKIDGISVPFSAAEYKEEFVNSPLRNAYRKSGEAVFPVPSENFAECFNFFLKILLTNRTEYGIIYRR